jgi:hypothetical protein
MLWIPCVFCIGVAAYLATQKIEGWGWFLFIAMTIAFYAAGGAIH